MNWRSRKRDGFSLIEVLLVVLILGAVSVSLISVFTYGFNVLSRTAQTNVATQVAQFEIERFRNMGFDQIPILSAGVPVTFQTLFDSRGPSDPDNPYAFLFKTVDGARVPILQNGRETIVIQSGAAVNMDPTVKKMTVTIAWDYRGRTITKDYVTLFYVEGINRR